MKHKDFLTENEVIQGVENFLNQKGRTTHRRIIHKADAAKKEHGADSVLKLENENKNGNWYFIESKGNRKADGSKMKSSCNSNFRWALKYLKIRLYGAFYQDGQLTAIEYLPKDLYK